MIKKQIALMVLSALLFTGCAETPKEVKSEIEDYKNAETVAEAEIITVPLSEAIEKANKFNEENKTNVSIKDIIVPQSKKMPTYDVKFYNEKVSDVFTKLQSEPLFGTDGQGTTVKAPGESEKWFLKKSYCFTSFASTNDLLYYGKDDEILISDWGTHYGHKMWATETGRFTLYSDEERTGVQTPRAYYAKKRIYSKFEQEKEEYTLFDGATKSVAEITEFAEDFCNSRFKESENNQFDYKVNYLDIREIEDDKYGFYMTLCRCDKYGNYFDSTRRYPFSFKEFENRNAFIASPIHMFVSSSDCISEFERNYTFTINEKNDNENIVPLDCAVDIVSNQLAQGKAYSFQTAELKYMFEITQSAYIDAAREFAYTEMDKNDWGAVCYSPDSVYVYGDYEITAIPYWVFTNYSGASENTNCGKMYMVNALDGSFRIENVNEYGNIEMFY